LVTSPNNGRSSFPRLSPSQAGGRLISTIYTSNVILRSTVSRQECFRVGHQSRASDHILITVRHLRFVSYGTYTYKCYWASPALSLSGSSPAELGDWVPFLSPLTTRRLRWKYPNLPSHGVIGSCSLPCTLNMDCTDCKENS
jgi:hypothetical protein